MFLGKGLRLFDGIDAENGAVESAEVIPSRAVTASPGPNARRCSLYVVVQQAEHTTRYDDFGKDFDVALESEALRFIPALASGRPWT